MLYINIGVFVCSQALGTDDAVTSELFITWLGKIVTANMTLGTSGNRSIDRDYFIKTIKLASVTMHI